MGTLAATADDLRACEDRAKDTTRPPAKGGPVLIADCVTPVSGETLLSLFWKRWDAQS
ncbi:hypothetical protein MWU54_15470 [Marivita sp. S6314]|uniref:hypothetical protein n=1 Tax=Marivita sp. S6314 TaxID=2926406 RepID=UPI001FF1FA03|nr:hypothetical protein [Marivita sp. S6314]MCK0151441.1 hypothetical protein [Marivita sp. S6314]